jgi:hypothetical protein
MDVRGRGPSPEPRPRESTALSGSAR